MKSGTQVLFPYIKDKGRKRQEGACVLATIEGDIHDIGKHSSLLLENHGFRIIDLGKMFPRKR